jgi:hypothetical protein
MGFLSELFEQAPVRAGDKPEMEKLLAELLVIGKKDDFLSEHPGGPFNMQCRHTRAKAIGKRLYDMGGMPLMDFIHRRVRRKIGAVLASHLEYAWDGVGEWKS